ncbi:MAG: DNA repair protein RadC [Patescibacteria group bacterium]
MKIKEFHSKDRPREKLERYGPERLKDAELLAILLGTGMKGTNAIELSSRVLARWKDIGLGTATLLELCEIPGLGKAKASGIVACFELGRRLLKDKKTSVLLSAKDVWERMSDIRESKREHFVVFYLDSREQEIRRDVVSIGTLNESLVHPREVFEQSIVSHASSVIFAHNHPSGDTEPSAADLEVTKRLVQAGRILDIAVIDHVIVTKGSWKSILGND